MSKMFLAPEKKVESEYLISTLAMPECSCPSQQEN